VAVPLLLIPAFYLSARWIMSVPVLIGDRIGFLEAFRRSWVETSDIFWPVLAALAVTVFMPTIAALLATLYWAEAGTALGPSLALNALGSGSTILSWHLAVAIYLHRRPQPQLTKVFA
jgi:hypothetical protein